MLSATKKWLSLKLSSVIMVPFMIWFLIKIVTIYDDDYENIKEFFIVVTFFHSAVSLSEIFEDYINSEKSRKFANMMVYLSSFIIPAITIITLYKL
jgi:succinate dehydrogenase / fumarate reductase membrane anchor subunit